MLSRLSSSCSRTAWTKASHCWKPLHSTGFLPQRSIVRQFTKISPSQQPWLSKQRVAAHVPKRVFTTKPPTSTVVKDTAKKTQPVAVAAADTKGRNATDWAIIKQLMKYIWPKNDIGVKARVVIALSLLIGGKLLNVQVPFFFKNVVDSLNITMPDDATLWAVCGAAIIGCK
ncbi:hypothetical protein K501DRAFT_72411 [Backusella circina FSU 941]|nr:hypothetical protein K501DRAFT_72411 [Backusella circina FSU 941]